MGLQLRAVDVLMFPLCARPRKYIYPYGRIVSVIIPMSSPREAVLPRATRDLLARGFVSKKIHLTFNCARAQPGALSRCVYTSP